MNASVVIGAGFGDEGKGNLTSYLASRRTGPETLVVRFNGGAQAGHTVQLPNGTRRVFHHFGSGTLNGAATYLSKYFIVNPLLYYKEGITLSSKVRNRVYVDPDAPLTTHYDMLINQEVERIRGLSKHGSCGIGIGETIERNERQAFRTVVRDCWNPKHLETRLREIGDYWVLSRIHQLVGIYKVSDEFLARVKDPNLFSAYMKYAQLVADTMHKVDIYDLDLRRQDIVFEGAQGLLLDQDHHFFPYVTRSHTGLRNVVDITTQMGVKHLDVFYVTRPYMTRHGAGPFPTERKDLSYPDPTNVPNDYQGALRFGDLDVPLIAQAIQKDLLEHDIDLSVRLAMTCCDQVPGEVARERLDDLQQATGIEPALLSYGPAMQFRAATICERAQT